MHHRLMRYILEISLIHKQLIKILFSFSFLQMLKNFLKFPNFFLLITDSIVWKIED